MKINNTLTEDIIRVNGTDIGNILKINNTLVTIPLITTNLTYYIDFSNTTCYPGTGTSIYDLATNITYSVVNGPTFSNASGANANGSFTFDGVNDYLVSTTDIDFTPSQYTVQIWVYITGTKAVNRLILNIEDANGDGIRHVITGTNTSPENRIFARINTEQETTTTTLNFQEWYLLTITFDDVNNTVKIYINDTLDSTYTNSQTIDVLAERIMIGATGNGGTVGTAGFLNGKVGANYIYEGVAFTDDDVIQNWNATKTRYGY